ncbi:RNA polymerase sigma factor [Micromonospora aurantiaca]|uniref:RNA polymerase sigma factor n=1 Tax=Micromonospora aurantiaca (nom. illeg.) TaxID=47850 RepID=UPI001CD929C8|nr:RNA polymerase sigma factor [Micromonospora aurantiaca]UFN97396.1 RNA polymerase sigma factor [Micromonospora aurantiaca]
MNDQLSVGGSRQDEERLLRQVARADLDAFDELYRRTSPWLAIRLRRRCADDGIVAEVLQDTYLTVWRAAGSFSGLRPSPDAPGGSAAGWIWTIAARRLVDALRRRARVQEVPTDVLPVRSAPAAEDEALAGSFGSEVGAALDALAPELRAVLAAMVLDGLTVRETSVLLGVPEGTVKSRARRARNALREALA